MRISAMGMERFLRASSALIILGLVIEAISLMWFHPLSFVLFAFVGVVLIGLGILVFLVSLIFAVPKQAASTQSRN